MRGVGRRLGCALALAGAALAAWSWSGRRLAPAPVGLRLVGFQSYGQDTGNGNLLGIQPWMEPGDYASQDRLRAKLDGYLAEAQSKGFIGEKTVVVLPEYLGVWLVAAGEKRSVYSAETLTQAARIMAASNLFSFLWRRLVVRAPDRATGALFAMKARAMAGMYQGVFSELAREYRVTIVAGSIFLPNPRVREGIVLAGRGPLYNACAVYGADGRACEPLVRKAFPTEEERRYVAAGEPEDLPVFETPAGRLGVLICADSWYPEAYRVLLRKGVEIIAVPSFVHRDGAWKQPWRGYSGAPPPEDVDEGDPATLSEGEAWRKYALRGRMAESKARAGMAVFLRGRMWELGSDGEATVVAGERVETYPQGEGATIVNFWLPAR
ncbi:MAG TPA: carbon-nitrogen hydrolase family protein [Armatimonadota bacterium]|nr:carbon-nitrogen hydrolase family protein [Armatimonadota bacterium]